MKQIFTICLLVFLGTTTVNAQTPNTTWAKRMGGNLSEYGRSIVTDAAGNVYITGDFQSTVDFDPSAATFNLTSAGGQDIFVCKLDSSGNFLWAKRMGGIGNDIGWGIAIDASGNVYTTGQFQNTVDFDPSPTTFNLIGIGTQDIFVSKLDASGNFLWAKRMGGTGSDIGYSVAVDASSNVYTTGSFTLTADFDPSTATFSLTAATDGSTEASELFVSKLDASGNFLWAKAMGGTSQEFGLGIAIDASNNVFTTGNFSGTADFDPSAATFTLTSAGGRDIFVSKLDASGSFLWAKAMGSSVGDDIGNKIAVDASGIVYITGTFNGTADFDPSAATFALTSAGNVDIFISKLDATGNFQWAKSMGSTSNDFGNNIVLDASGNVYTTGSFIGTVDFDPSAATFNLTSSGAAGETFISKLDASGNFLWAKSMGGTGLDVGFGIALDASSNIYATGAFTGTSNFNPSGTAINMTSVGAVDIFVIKVPSSNNAAPTFSNSTTTLSLCQGSTATSINSLLQITDADAGQTATFTVSNAPNNGGSITVGTTVASGTNVSPTDWSYTPAHGFTGTETFTIQVSDGNGGTASKTITVTVIATSSSTFNTSVCGSYTWAAKGNKVYTASNNTDTIKLVNAAGCDSIVTLNLTIKTASSSTTIVSTCPSQLPYSWNGSRTAAGTYTFTTTNSQGCDSVATLNLTVKTNTTSTTNVSICPSALPYSWNGSRTAAGTYTFTTTNSQGCDSVATLNLTINTSTNNVTTQNACGSYTWNGQTYFTSGTYTYGYNNANGCASVDTLYLTINQASVSTYAYDTICSSQLPYVWMGETFSAQGSKPKFLTNASGCDSVVTLVLRIKHGSSSTTNLSICNNQLPYSWNGLVFTTADTKTAYITNAAGCDSAATLNLSIRQTTSSSTSGSYCPSELPFTWNGLNITNPGTYTKTGLTNKAGCDSSASLVVTLKPGPLFNKNFNTKLDMTTYTFCRVGDSLPVINYTSMNTSVWSTSNPNVIVIKPNTDKRMCMIYANAVGTATLTYTVTTAGGCPSLVNTVVSIAPQSIPNAITGPSSLCSGTSTTYSSTTTGGVWSSINSRITVNSNTGLATANSVGNGTLTYTVTNAAGCKASATYPIVTLPMPSLPSISYAPGNAVNPQSGAGTGNMCRNRTFTLVGNPLGGEWFGGGVINVSNTGTVTTGNVAGAGSINYRITGANSCTNTRILNVNIVACATKGSNAQQLTSNSFTVYPNPAKDVINVKFDRLSAGTIAVTDLYGKQLSAQPISFGNNTIDVSKFAKGMYIVNVITENGREVKKIVVE